jgi:hypothetical protein
MHTPVPVEAAVHISHTYGKSMVVILAYDPLSQLTHTTTYGRTAVEKETAARAGEVLSKVLGCDLGLKKTFEDFHRDPDGMMAARHKEALELLSGAVNDSVDEDWLKRARTFLKASL